MRKIIYFILIVLLCLGLFLLVGCSKEDKKVNENNTNISDSQTIDNDGSDISTSLKNPKLEWCQLYNPNGFDTITGILSNPNNVDIDVTYDLVYYKDGKEVARTESFSNFNVSPKHNDVIWANVDIPKASDVDEIKMENIQVSKAYHNSIDAEIKYLETKDDEAYFSVKYDKQPTFNNITFLLYNDENKNKKCDQGELVVTSIDNTIENEDIVSFVTEGYNYTDYEAYYNAY